MDNSADEAEKLRMAGVVAMAFHLEAMRRSTYIFSGLLGIGVTASYMLGNWWILGGALIISGLAHFIVLHSCHRHIIRSMGMPWQAIAFFREKYRSDPEFAREVNTRLARAKGQK